MVVPFKVVVKVHSKVLSLVTDPQNGATYLVHMGQDVPPPPDMHHVTLWGIVDPPRTWPMSPVRSCCSTSLSAKSLTEVPDPTADGMSFTYRRNSSGPNTVLPCGTPEVTGEYSDFTPSHTTIWWWFMRKDSIQRRTLPWIPYRRSLLKRRLWGTVIRPCWSRVFQSQLGVLHPDAWAAHV